MKQSTLISFILISFNSLSCPIEVFFSPSGLVAKSLISKIDQAKKRVYAAVYMLTEKSIVEALARAAQRNVDVKIILDKISLESPWGKALVIKQAGAKIFVKESLNQSRRILISSPENIIEAVDDIVPFLAAEPIKIPAKEVAVKFFRAEPIMHHKYAIIDDCVWTGSFNWTVSANTKNNENALFISQETQVLKLFLNNFVELEKKSINLELETIISMKKKFKDFVKS